MCINTHHHKRMVHAYMFLSNRYIKHNNLQVNSKLYEKLKSEWIELLSGIPKTEEHKQKISHAHKQKWLTEEHPNKGKVFTNEHKRKLSKTRKQRKLAEGSNNGMYGKNHTNNAKKKISKTRKEKGIGKNNNNPMYGKKNPNLSKWNAENNVKYKVGQYDKNDKLICVYAHAAEAGKVLGIKYYRNINYVAKNWKKYPNRTAYGFKWRYLSI